MQKRGFTLIELLAVIVIIAVIALISTPLVMNAILNAERSAAKSSAYGYIRAIEFSIANKQMLHSAYTIPNTFITADDQNLDYKGTRPTAVDLELTDGRVTGGTITIDEYTMTIGTNGQVINITP